MPARRRAAPTAGTPPRGGGDLLFEHGPCGLCHRAVTIASTVRGGKCLRDGRAEHCRGGGRAAQCRGRRHRDVDSVTAGGTVSRRRAGGAVSQRTAGEGLVVRAGTRVRQWWRRDWWHARTRRHTHTHTHTQRAPRRHSSSARARHITITNACACAPRYVHALEAATTVEEQTRAHASESCQT